MRSGHYRYTGGGLMARKQPFSPEQAYGPADAFLGQAALAYGAMSQQFGIACEADMDTFVRGFLYAMVLGRDAPYFFKHIMDAFGEYDLQDIPVSTIHGHAAGVQAIVDAAKALREREEA